MVTQGEYQAACAKVMPEKDLLASVREMAVTLGFLVYHTHDSRRSEGGWPDVAIAGHGRLLVRELKRQSGVVTPEQKVWLATLSRCGCGCRGVAANRPSVRGDSRRAERCRSNGRWHQIIQRYCRRCGDICAILRAATVMV